MKREIKIKTEDNSFRVPLGSGGAAVTGGLGGWTEIARPDGRPITEWVGAEALKVDVPIMLDGWPRDSIERDKNRIFKLGRKRDGEQAPSPFKVTGPIFFSGMRFVLNGTPEFGEIIRDNSKGRLLRLPATLHLMEYVRGDQIRIKKPGGGGSENRTYTVKKGDTIRSIAKAVADGANVSVIAKEIAIANKIRDVRKPLKAGDTLRLPLRFEAS